MGNGLSKKDKRLISKEITKKLEAMGVRDEISYVPSGKKVRRPVVENNEFKVEDGKIVMEEFDVPVAINTLRRTVRTLRNAPVEQIQAFLTMPMPNSSSEETSVVENGV